MREHVARELGGVISLAPALAGTHVIGWPEASRPGRDWAISVARAASEADLVIFPLSRYTLNPPVRDGLVLGYGGLTPDRIAKGARRLARVIDRCSR